MEALFYWALGVVNGLCLCWVVVRVLDMRIERQLRVLSKLPPA